MNPASDDTIERERQAAAPNLLARFREHLASGSYDDVIGRGLKRTLRGAAADAGLDAEIGALRLTLVRLLNEEDDPSRLASGVARVAGVAVQAARLRATPDAALEHIRALLLREVDALEREYAEQAAEEARKRRSLAMNLIDGTACASGAGAGGAPRHAPARHSEPISLEPASAYEAVTRQMVLSLEDDLREIKSRLNGLLFMVAGSVLLEVLTRVMGDR